MAERAMTDAEAETVQAALAYRDIRAVEDTGQHVSPAIRQFSEQRLRRAAERVVKERDLEVGDAAQGRPPYPWCPQPAVCAGVRRCSRAPNCGE